MQPVGNERDADDDHHHHHHHHRTSKKKVAWSGRATVTRILPKAKQVNVKHRMVAEPVPCFLRDVAATEPNKSITKALVEPTRAFQAQPLRQLRASETYRALPREFHKSALRRDELCDLLGLAASARQGGKATVPASSPPPPPHESERAPLRRLPDPLPQLSPHHHIRAALARRSRRTQQLAPRAQVYVAYQPVHGRRKGPIVTTKHERDALLHAMITEHAVSRRKRNGEADPTTLYYLLPLEQVYVDLAGLEQLARAPAGTTLRLQPLDKPPVRLSTAMPTPPMPVFTLT